MKTAGITRADEVFGRNTKCLTKLYHNAYTGSWLPKMTKLCGR